MPKNQKKIALAAGYTALVKRIQSELSELDFFVRRRTAEGWWKVGGYIDGHLLENKDRADYGSLVLERLADDVGRDVSTLRRALQFYHLYPIRAVPHELSWDHFRSLITVHDKAKRIAFEKKALEKEWTSEELGEAIRLDRLKAAETEGPAKHNSGRPLVATRSRLFTYQILEPGYIHPIEEKLIIDLGFNMLVHTEIKGVKAKAEELVESTKIGDSYKFKLSDAKPKELYTYNALVERVIDADTIWLNIDLGFSSWTRQKVRLRGIDAPELSTKEGQEAKKFVEAKLKNVEFVVVKTHKSDKYDRYLTDIFYSPDKDPQAVLEQGVFLNQQLLDFGWARIWE